MYAKSGRESQQLKEGVGIHKGMHLRALIWNHGNEDLLIYGIYTHLTYQNQYEACQREIGVGCPT